MVEKIDQRLNLSPPIILKRLTGNILLLLAFWVWTLSPLQAQEINLISDEESEQFLAEITKPLFNAAGVRFDRNKIFIVNDASLNAFVADGNNLFIHSGTILAADTPGELAGVIAHETGHIEGGHILRQKLKAREMSEITLASALLAGAAAAASGRGDAAMAVLLGSQSSALTHYMRYRTEEERSADEAAIKLLNATRQSPDGMLAFMKKISQQNSLNGREESPYFRTHPVTRERISFFEEAVKNSSYSADTKLQNKLNLVKAKLYAFLNSPAATTSRYPSSDHSSAATYARSIAAFKSLKLPTAQQELDKLLAQDPGNPYYHELKGQFFLETGKIKPAITEYKKALQTMPHSALLNLSLAQAMLENSPTKGELQQIVTLLNRVLINRPSAGAWLLLSRAYGMQGKEAAANFAAAEFSLRIGAREVAQRQAEQAKRQNQDPKLALKLDDLLLRIRNLNEK